ncbi:hypothetical protein F5Y15DRAFT_21267 [Xylariaceae sp. FL0016]|nr:hypothetical protein F5Y15DRAFT_21267 [Xylariaceae sp. FL0016]
MCVGRMEIHITSFNGVTFLRCLREFDPNEFVPISHGCEWSTTPGILSSRLGSMPTPLLCGMEWVRVGDSATITGALWPTRARKHGGPRGEGVAVRVLAFFWSVSCVLPSLWMAMACSLSRSIRMTLRRRGKGHVSGIATQHALSIASKVLTGLAHTYCCQPFIS